MVIQNRRGNAEDFVPSNLLPGEFAVVQDGDSSTTSGVAVYMCIRAGVVKRFVLSDELTDFLTNGISWENIEDVPASIAAIESNNGVAWAHIANKPAILTGIVTNSGIDWENVLNKPSVNNGTGTNSVKLNSANNVASGINSTAEGSSTTAAGSASHAEGYNTQASNLYSHAEGRGTVASGQPSHAEGYSTQASGNSSHAEGTGSIAAGGSSHAEGSNTRALGMNSHAEGDNTIASGRAQHVSGKLNVEDTLNTYAEIVGNGTAWDARSNARTLDWEGNEKIAGSLTIGSDTEDEVELTPTQLTNLLNLLLSVPWNTIEDVPSALQNIIDNGISWNQINNKPNIPTTVSVLETVIDADTVSNTCEAAAPGSSHVPDTRGYLLTFWARDYSVRTMIANKTQIFLAYGPGGEYRSMYLRYYSRLEEQWLDWQVIPSSTEYQDLKNRVDDIVAITLDDAQLTLDDVPITTLVGETDPTSGDKFVIDSIAKGIRNIDYQTLASVLSKYATETYADSSLGGSFRSIQSVINEVYSSRLFSEGTALSSGTNLNTITTPGVYWYHNATSDLVNIPPYAVDTGMYVTLFVFYRAITTRLYQVLFTTKGVWYRCQQNETNFYDWQRLNNAGETWYVMPNITTREEGLNQIDAWLNATGQAHISGYIATANAVILGLGSNSYYLDIYAHSGNSRAVVARGLTGRGFHVLNKVSGTWNDYWTNFNQELAGEAEIVASTTNINDYIIPGTYFFNSGTKALNAPNNSNYFRLTVVAPTGSLTGTNRVRYQEAVTTDGLVFTRLLNSSDAGVTWTAEEWRRLGGNSPSFDTSGSAMAGVERLTTSTNINQLLVGEYFWSDANTRPSANIPDNTAVRGRLWALDSGGGSFYCCQICYTSSFKWFIRYCTSKSSFTWTAWEEVPTRAELDAVTPKVKTAISDLSTIQPGEQGYFQLTASVSPIGTQAYFTVWCTGNADRRGLIAVYTAGTETRLFANAGHATNGVFAWRGWVETPTKTEVDKLSANTYEEIASDASSGTVTISRCGKMRILTFTDVVASSNALSLSTALATTDRPRVLTSAVLFASDNSVARVWIRQAGTIGTTNVASGKTYNGELVYITA